MNIGLIPVDGNTGFMFPALPEKIQVKYGAKYQSFDIISKGTVKVPKGMDAAEFSWDGVFFGRSKRREAIVKRRYWKAPNECVQILKKFMEDEAVMSLVVTGTWINVDVTIGSFQPKPTGAYGNVEYSITFVEKKPLQIYTTSELQIASFTQLTEPRNDLAADNAAAGRSYTVVSGDTLYKIARTQLGNAGSWTYIYDINAATIEAAAKAHGKASSDHGHWIWPGEILIIPG